MFYQIEHNRSNRYDCNPVASARGFTLLELLVVTVLILTATAVVAPNLGSRVRQAQLDSGATRLDALVRHARTKAVIDRQEIVLILSGDGRYIRLQYKENPTMPVRTPPVDLGETVRIRISEMSNGSASNGVTFSPNGTASETVFVLSSSSGTRQLRLEPSRGRLRLESSQG